MTMSRQLTLLQVEYINGNYQRVSELADPTIVSVSDDAQLAMAWLYKGPSTAAMSTMKQQRPTNAVSYFQEAQKHDLHPALLTLNAVQLSKLTLQHVKHLQNFYTQDSQNRLAGRRGTVNHSPNEDMSEYAGRELGQAFIDMAVSAGRQRQIAWRLASILRVTMALQLSRRLIKRTQPQAKAPKSHKTRRM